MAVFSIFGFVHAQCALDTQNTGQTESKNTQFQLAGNFAARWRPDLLVGRAR